MAAQVLLVVTLAPATSVKDFLYSVSEAGADCLGKAPRGVMEDSFWKKEQQN